MATTEQVYKNNNYALYEEADNSSETSKDYPSSNSSYADDAKKRYSFEDNKEEKNKDKRSKRNSFISIFKKDDKEKEEKEKPQSEGLSRSLSGIFNKDKEKEKEKEEKEKPEGLSRSLSAIFNKDKDKRTSTVESEKHLRPTSRTSSNSDKTKNRRSFIFFSDDDEKLDDGSKKGRKSRQNSNPDGVEKDKSAKIGNLINKIFDSKPSQRPNTQWADNFIEPDETMISPKSPKTTLKNKPIPEYVESPTGTGTNGVNGVNGVNKSPAYFLRHDTSKDKQVITEDDDGQSTHSSTRPSSVEISSSVNKHKVEFSESDSPTTPKLIVTHPELGSTEHHEPTKPESTEIVNQQLKKDDDNNIKQDVNNVINSSNSTSSKPKLSDVEQNNINSSSNPKVSEAKVKMVRPLVISTDVRSINNNNDTAKKPEQQNNITIAKKPEQQNNTTIAKKPEQQNNTTIAKKPEQQNNTTATSNDQVLKKLQELEVIKSQLEAKVAKQDGQISKFNSMEQIMQQQIELSKRMTETIHRLESKVNVQKEELNSTNADKILEETVKRLENKLSQQNEELSDLKSIVEQLNGGNPQLAITRIAHDEGQNQFMSPHEAEDRRRALIQSNHYSRNTLVDTLVVKPLCNTVTVSASIAVSVLYAVYVRPVIGLIKVAKVVKDGM